MVNIVLITENKDIVFTAKVFERIISIKRLGVNDFELVDLEINNFELDEKYPFLNLKEQINEVLNSEHHINDGASIRGTLEDVIEEYRDTIQYIDREYIKSTFKGSEDTVMFNDFDLLKEICDWYNYDLAVLDSGEVTCSQGEILKFDSVKAALKGWLETLEESDKAMVEEKAPLMWKKEIHYIQSL